MLTFYSARDPRALLTRGRRGIDVSESRRKSFERLSRARRHQLLVEWNDSQRRYFGTGLLHQLFETRAAESPNAVAVVADGDHLTYGELDRLAESLAQRLKSLGVRRI